MFPDTIQWFGHFGWLKTVAKTKQRSSKKCRPSVFTPFETWPLDILKDEKLILTSDSLWFNQAKSEPFYPKFSSKFGFLEGYEMCSPFLRFLTQQSFQNFEPDWPRKKLTFTKSTGSPWGG